MVVSRAACVKRTYFGPHVCGNKGHRYEVTSETLCLVLGPQRLGTLTSQVCVDRKFETEADLAKSVAFGALAVQGSGVDVDIHV